jgi:predicted  nucleic acid-binding Zn-ribbon protein
MTQEEQICRASAAVTHPSLLRRIAELEKTLADTEAAAQNHILALGRSLDEMQAQRDELAEKLKGYQDADTRRDI